METFYSTSLILTGINVTQFGVYIAEIQNIEGCQYCIVIVQNSSTPETPKDIEIENVSWDRFTLSWIPGFDGGYNQTIILEFLEIFKLDNHDLTLFNNCVVKSLPKVIEINQVPKIPIKQRCEISGLAPNTRYKFVMYARNVLGQGRKSEEYTITTKVLHFPQVITTNQQNNLMNIQFMHSNDSQLFCIKTEYSQSDRMNWSILLDTCQMHREIKSSSTVIKNTLRNFEVIIENILVMNNTNGYLVRELQSSRIMKANSDDPNLSDISKKFKHHRKQVSVFPNFENAQNSLNTSSNNDLSNSHDNIILHMDNHFAYRVWTCIKNQSNVCYQTKLFHKDATPNLTSHKLKSKLGLIVLAILIVLLIFCTILAFLYLRQHRNTNTSTMTLLHNTEKHLFHTCIQLPEKTIENGSLLPVSSCLSINGTDIMEYKQSTSNLTIYESKFISPTTMIPLTYDIAYNQIPFLSYHSDIQNSMKTSPSIELSQTFIEYKPTSIELYSSQSTSMYNLPSTCSIIPLDSNVLYTNNNNNNNNLSPILIIPAKTFPSVTYQCSI
ncbi:unnamed protein product [Heterobilharzia americana]|nr:unnamed protein product [Heterobilharzia americana]